MNSVVKYFNGEKAESYIFILIGVIAFAMALYFIFGLKTSFWKGVAIPFFVVACLEFVVGYTIVTRSQKDINRVDQFVVFNISDLLVIAEKYNVEVITNEFLYKNGYISKTDLTKVLSDGDINKSLIVSANRFSTTAKEKISAAGGKALIEFKTNQLQGIAHADNIETVTPKVIAQYFPYFEENDLLHVTAEGSLRIKFNIEAHIVDDNARALIQGQGANIKIID
jgi:ribosomal protein L15